LAAVAVAAGSWVTVGVSPARAADPGAVWTAQTAAEANHWYPVTFGNGVFVALAFNGTHRVMTSPDGVTWTAQTAAEANGWFSVTIGNGVFVAVAFDGTHQVMTSNCPTSPAAPVTTAAPVTIQPRFTG
jgi:hypothetical protein